MLVGKVSMMRQLLSNSPVIHLRNSFMWDFLLQKNIIVTHNSHHAVLNSGPITTEACQINDSSNYGNEGDV